MECITHCHCIAHLVISFHHILHCIIPHQTPSLTLIPNYATFHVTPALLAISHILYYTSTSRSTPYSPLQYHISDRTISATLCITPLTSRISCTPHSMYSTPHVSDDAIYWPHLLCTTTSHTTPHFTQHCTAFHVLHI